MIDYESRQRHKQFCMTHIMQDGMGGLCLCKLALTRHSIISHHTTSHMTQHHSIIAPDISSLPLFQFYFQQRFFLVNETHSFSHLSR